MCILVGTRTCCDAITGVHVIRICVYALCVDLRLEHPNMPYSGSQWINCTTHTAHKPEHSQGYITTGHQQRRYFLKSLCRHMTMDHYSLR